MHLFDKVPENLFGVLSSGNRHIYTDALFVLRQAFKTHLTIKRDDLVVMILSRLEDSLLDIQDEQEQEDLNLTDLSARANFIVRRLESAGWIRIDFQGDSFEEVVVLPDYSVTLINAFYEITSERTREYNYLVVSTYNNLKNADAERNEYTFTTLESAYKDTLQLLDLLKSLYNNIGRYHQKLIEYKDANEILKSHFDSFKEKIIDKIYHPFKTLDSVPRFKMPILRILRKWEEDEKLIEKMAEQAVKYNHCETVSDGVKKVIENINYIQETYETLGEVISQTDRKHALYTRATIEKIQYLISRDKNIKGRLVSILQKINSAEDYLFEKIQNETELFSQAFMDSQSLYTRSRIKRTGVSNPVKVVLTSEKEKNELFRDFSSGMDYGYSGSKIKKYVLELLENETVSSRDIPLENDEDYMKLIISAIKAGQKDMPHDIVFGEGSLKRGKYEIPEMRFVRKGKVK